MDVNKVLDVTKTLAYYYTANRQVGNTTLMKRGTSNFELEKRVLVINMQHGKDLGISKRELVTIDTLDQLQGLQVPLAIDNAVLFEIFTASLLAITSRDARIKELELKMNKNIDGIIVKYEKKLKTLNSRKNMEKFLRESAEKEIEEMKNNPFKTLFKSLSEKWDVFWAKWIGY